ncbi:alpha/beta hydrolase [Altericroceibacterium xinjiangense]|uniref:alpha/beta hydrolase n=1 Tax=Altericroceibacterium xinjiangense TaxID=762261 RepID=UPI000F7EDCF8|nr:alpha/beta fold hydrolase [Altericroceibacterium xinjiangense]
MKTFLAGLGALAALALAAVPAQARVEKVTVHGPSLEGNYEGNSPDRSVMVFLPPNYDADPDKRYPVVYFLHGFALTDQTYADYVKMEDAVNEAAAAGNELILVLPDAMTRQRGAMYSDSPTTGNWERFVARDLVSYVDGRYRTIPDRASRGLAGHSMGGYGTLRIGQKNPDVFSSLYAMSACCLSPRTWSTEELNRLSAMSVEEQKKASFGDAAALASLAAWSPSPEGPNYFDAGVKDGTVDPLVQARTYAASPIAMLPQYVSGLKTMKAIALDVGDKDTLVRDDTWMHEELDRFGVPHQWEVYAGDHVNRLTERTRTKVLPFFGKNLAR